MTNQKRGTGYRFGRYTPIFKSALTGTVVTKLRASPARLPKHSFGTGWRMCGCGNSAKSSHLVTMIQMSPSAIFSSGSSKLHMRGAYHV